MTLRQLRESCFILQMELAEKIGVAPSTISKWEAGQSQPDLRYIRLLGSALHVTPEEVQQAMNEQSEPKTKS